LLCGLSDEATVHAAWTLPEVGEMTGTSRRRFLQYGVGAIGLASVTRLGSKKPGQATASLPHGGQTGAGSSAGGLRPFLEPLPVPGNGIVVAAPVAPGRYSFTLREIRRQLHPDLPATPVSCGSTITRWGLPG
jgi:hypothetical protein